MELQDLLFAYWIFFEFTWLCSILYFAKLDPNVCITPK